MKNHRTGKYWDEFWSPVVGCSPNSPGCRKCWAATVVHRWPDRFGPTRSPFLTGAGPDGPMFTKKFAWKEDWIDRPKSWKKPRVIAVNWLGDLFHEEVPAAWQYKTLETAAECIGRGHRFLFLTKRPKNMVDVVANWIDSAPFDSTRLWCPDDLLMGATICTQQEAEAGLTLLRHWGPFWLSVEPLLEAVDLSPYFNAMWICPRCEQVNDTPHGLCSFCDLRIGDIGLLLQKPAGVVVGGESGGTAIPREWVEPIRILCRDHDVPFYFKQWGGTKKGRDYETEPGQTDHYNGVPGDHGYTPGRQF